jgi:hypothetical protein
LLSKEPGLPFGCGGLKLGTRASGDFPLQTCVRTRQSLSSPPPIS